MSKSNNATGWYAEFFKAWQVTLQGAKPTAEMLANMHNLGLRPGKQALACAMALRDGGVTGAQIMITCGAPQLNRMRGLITGGLCKREPAAATAQGHTVYRLTLTKKGQARIDRTIAANAKAEAQGDGAVVKAKPKAATKPARVTRKRNAAKPAPVQAPTTGDAPVAPATQGDVAAQPQG